MLFTYLYHGDLYTQTCGKSDLYFRPANAERSFDSNSTNTFYDPQSHPHGDHLWDRLFTKLRVELSLS